MFSKAYTAIIQKGNSTKAVDLFSDHDGNTARQKILKDHPGYELIALVPGKHAKWCHIYDMSEKENALRNVSSGVQSIDVWNTHELMEN